jgi:diguanylate cyclase (GGDEF)-like protein
MNFSTIVEQIHGIACVISVRPGTDGERSIFSIEAANRAYLASVGKENEEFAAGRPYTYYIHQDLNFESNVRRCVQTKSIQHQYVNAGLYDAWLDIYMIPMDVPGEKEYCLFTYELTSQADTEKLLDVSSNTAVQVLRTCIKLRESSDFQTAMDSIIKDIRKMCDSSGCAVLLTDFKKKTCQILSADNDGSFKMGDNDVVFSKEFFRIAETWRNLMAGSNCYIIADEDDMNEAEKHDRIWTDSLRSSGVHNVVLYPLRVKDKILGYIWATNFNADKTVFIKEVMELTAFFLSAEIASHKLFEKLEMMSRYDMLTETLSRNAMNTRVDEWVSGRNASEGDFGVVFVDVNGLKQVNDEEGHAAGDLMIKAVADRIREYFGDYEIYRAGGDEFMVLAPGIEKAEFEGRIKELKTKEEANKKARFAVGSFYDDSAHDIRAAIEVADMNMYADKADYYKRHPEFNRRIK